MSVIVLLLTVPLLISALTYAFFWYETASSPHRQYLADLAHGKVGRLLLKGILSSYFSILITVLLYPTGLWRRTWQPPSEQECSHPPVILVHGLYHNVSAWTPFRHWLQAAGFSNIYALGYRCWNQSFAALVMKLEELLVQVGERFPDQPPILVGHSLGGLLSRALAQTVDDPARLAGVITLGTPHKGSKLAAFGLGRLAKSLLYRSPMLDALETGKGQPGIPRVALYSPIDNMVLPNRALQTTEAGWVHQETALISHVAMLYHRPTAMLVVEYLKSMTKGGS